jgi:hypothetical protein
MKGFNNWLHPSATRSRATTFGSLARPDVWLTSAYYEQFHQLGWLKFCLSRIRLPWSETVIAYKREEHPIFDSTHWASTVISLLWQFTRDCWHFRNQIVHGETVHEAINHQMQQLHDKVAHQYQSFQDNNTYILPCHHHLITTKTLEESLRMSYDSITYWFPLLLLLN